ncbi:polyprenyl synthetase family protein [Candidatus Riesia pediculischaeffi]|uniref:Octaprenyl diphosphate synthase n=1 Tax=Candidatus Riesia pediculischaeffi PTSU TaxID=1401651 RepID=A0A0C1V5W2_9ENTR|nr:polyprenyl synthetase family protein [Candidatus Riesia pediculischaeffi]KIE63789.1 Octaprenyl diphosphate synthase [Candidatus Riesia pediculischaeffi PTSU]
MKMKLGPIVELIKEEMYFVNKLILDQFRSDIRLINELMKYFNKRSGKRIRPIITLLCSKILGFRGKKNIIAASLIEFIHIATLLHDDIIDSSVVRRGQKKSSIVFGNEANVLIGDLVYTKSLKMMIELDSKKVLELITDTVHIIVQGEILQLSNRNLEISENLYMKTIYQKTSSLFEAASCITATICNVDSDKKKVFKKYGRHFGNAFQLINDIRDYKRCNNYKCSGNDLNDGNFTLPLIHVMKKIPAKESIKIKKMIQDGRGRYALKRILPLMKRYRSLEYSEMVAKKEVKYAIRSLSHLEYSSYKIALTQLAISILY